MTRDEIADRLEEVAGKFDTEVGDIFAEAASQLIASFDAKDRAIVFPAIQEVTGESFSVYFDWPGRQASEVADLFRRAAAIVRAG